MGFLTPAPGSISLSLSTHLLPVFNSSSRPTTPVTPRSCTLHNPQGFAALTPLFCLHLGSELPERNPSLQQAQLLLGTL